MAEKNLNVRISLKYDTYANWIANNPVLKVGEMALCTVPTQDTNGISTELPAVLAKVGDGVSTYSTLPFLSAKAADVYSWAKAANKPTYSASEITGLSDYISGEIQDTDTQYKIVKVNDYNYKLKELVFEDDEKAMELIMEAISAVRNRRAEMNVPPSKKAKTIIVTDETDTFSKGAAFFEKLASASEVEVRKNKDGISPNAVNIVVPSAEIFLPLDELVDKDKELKRLNDEKKKLEGEIKRVQGKLSNQGFVAKAPQKVVDEEKAKGEKYKEMLDKVLESIKAMENI